ncbi:hypothetical protein MPTK1_4g10770 [Marchantia polymorpha subsp. ruderalis]|uniref:Uncharacterized protein n=2 Tax=Marchantia polymorpha TaxID=3197 RepID=A0AAF6B8K7_MARPO|nr:hypothetical protein MARPO_0011s0063 [Marchantia polymorpha]BBN08341.1 hypothetical protein Mp_4g10770 [Marchantia polymorpha subsp. ruderalis]|eukprot:PTQ46377.1 hypothetical protein MARPO_0011s0063 [Marchantia polymorpha]
MSVTWSLASPSVLCSLIIFMVYFRRRVRCPVIRSCHRLPIYTFCNVIYLQTSLTSHHGHSEPRLACHCRPKSLHPAISSGFIDRHIEAHDDYSALLTLICPRILDSLSTVWSERVNIDMPNVMSHLVQVALTKGEAREINFWTSS